MISVPCSWNTENITGNRALRDAGLHSHSHLHHQNKASLRMRQRKQPGRVLRGKQRSASPKKLFQAQNAALDCHWTAPGVSRMLMPERIQLGGAAPNCAHYQQPEQMKNKEKC